MHWTLATFCKKIAKQIFLAMSSGKRDRQIAMELDRLCVECNVNPKVDRFELCSACYGNRTHAPSKDEHQVVSNKVLEKFSLSMGYGQQVCSICFDTIEPQQNMTTLPCFDMFHKECISSWFKKKLVCPLHTDNPLS